MRDIKFRAKRVDNGEWVYGSLFVDDCYDGETECYIEYMNYKTLPYKKSVKVKPETLGQFTGPCDKNGEEIFEGDIVKRNLAYITITAIVEWDLKYLQYTLTAIDKENKGKVWYLTSNSEDYEIIGNVYDNPELLKGE